MSVKYIIDNADSSLSEQIITGDLLVTNIISADTIQSNSLTFGDDSVQTTAYVPTTSGNTDNLGGANMRTIYSRTNVITYDVGADADLFSGSTNFGSRNFPSSFFTNSVNYSNKIIHFRVTGKWGTIVTPNSDVVITTKFGNDIVATSSITLDFSSNKPSEIFGEIIINNGSAIVCYSVGWCDQTGDFRRSPLSDPSTPLVVSGFNGGDFKLIIGSATDNRYTSYTGYIQVWN